MSADVDHLCWPYVLQHLCDLPLYAVRDCHLLLWKRTKAFACMAQRLKFASLLEVNADLVDYKSHA